MAQAQAPAAQVWPVGQAWPQAPQLAPSVCVLTQAVPQSIWPVAQPQTPAVQLSPVPQALPQEPQFAPLVCVSTQVAVAPVGVQSVWPVGHVWPATHALAVHVWPVAQA